MFDQVVVGIRDDDEAGGDALALAKRLGSSDGELTLLHVHVVATDEQLAPDAPGNEEKRRYAVTRLAALANELAAEAQASCVESLSVRRGLYAFASGRRADLLVVAASRRDDLARVFVGDDTSRVLEDPPCAVAVAPAGYRASGARLERIGVAYDGSPESEMALELARILARQRQADLSVFEAVGAGFYVRDPSNPEAEMQELVASARTRLSALGELDAQVGFGDTVEELSRFGQSVDLLVIGGHRHRPIGRLLEGSIAQQLADQTSIPLLALPATTTRSSASAAGPPRLHPRVPNRAA